MSYHTQLETLTQRTPDLLLSINADLGWTSAVRLVMWFTEPGSLPNLKRYFTTVRMHAR